LIIVFFRKIMQKYLFIFFQFISLCCAGQYTLDEANQFYNYNKVDSLIVSSDINFKMLSKFKMLKYLSIFEKEKTDVDSINLGDFPKLEELEIRNLNKLKKINFFNNQSSGIVAVSVMNIYRMDDLSFLSDFKKLEVIKLNYYNEQDYLLDYSIKNCFLDNSVSDYDYKYPYEINCEYRGSSKLHLKLKEVESSVFSSLKKVVIKNFIDENNFSFLSKCKNVEELKLVNVRHVSVFEKEFDLTHLKKIEISLTCDKTVEFSEMFFSSANKLEELEIIAHSGDIYFFGLFSQLKQLKQLKIEGNSWLYFILEAPFNQNIESNLLSLKKVDVCTRLKVIDVKAYRKQDNMPFSLLDKDICCKKIDYSPKIGHGLSELVTGYFNGGIETTEDLSLSDKSNISQSIDLTKFLNLKRFSLRLWGEEGKGVLNVSFGKKHLSRFSYYKGKNVGHRQVVLNRNVSIDSVIIEGMEENQFSSIMKNVDNISFLDLSEMFFTSYKKKYFYNCLKNQNELKELFLYRVRIKKTIFRQHLSPEFCKNSNIEVLSRTGYSDEQPFSLKNLEYLKNLQFLYLSRDTYSKRSFQKFVKKRPDVHVIVIR